MWSWTSKWFTTRYSLFSENVNCIDFFFVKVTFLSRLKVYQFYECITDIHTKRWHRCFSSAVPLWPHQQLAVSVVWLNWSILPFHFKCDRWRRHQLVLQSLQRKWNDLQPADTWLKRMWDKSTWYYSADITVSLLASFAIQFVIQCAQCSNWF